MNETNFADPNIYLEKRVDDQLSYYQNAANKQKRKFVYTQSTIIILGLLLPVVINLPKDLGSVDLTLWIQLTTTVMSLSLAILNGMLNFLKFGDLWLSYRMTEEVLKQEKYLFLASAGQYKEKENAYSLFVETVESIISSEHNKFRNLINEARRPSKDKSEDHM